MLKDNGIYYLYRHIRLDKNEPFYIGIGTKKKNAVNWKVEFTRGFFKYNRGSIWKRIVAKTDYEVEIVLESDDYNFIKRKEVEFIALYGRINRKTGTLANLTDGGDGAKGMVASETHRDNLRKAYKKRIENGYIHKGYKHTEETKAHLSRIRMGKYPSQETKDKLSKIHKGRSNPWNHKKIYQYNLEGKFIKEYCSITKASEETGILICDISSAAFGKRRKHTAGGYQWRGEKKETIDKYSLQDNSRYENSVIQYDKQGIEIKEWKTVSIAARTLKLNRSAIANCLVGISQSSGGFKWKYKEDKTQENGIL